MVKQIIWIPEKLSRSHTSIGRFLQRYDQNATICRAEGIGRKKKSTERDDREIGQSVQVILKKTLT